MDKSWLLNTKAINAAKRCIQIVDQELGVRLKLSHPDFLKLLYEYAELTESAPLTDAVNTLVDMAGADVKKELMGTQKPSKVARIEEFRQATEPTDASQAQDEQVEYRGRTYEKFRGGLQFKGLYRGQPRYA